MKYIKLFDKLSDFESVKDNLDRPNVSLVQETNSVSYLAASAIAIDYSKEYLTIEALEDGLTAKLSSNTCEYCVDNGDWTTLAANTNTVSINKGQTLQFKIYNPRIISSASYGNYGIGTFTISKKCNISGNIISLLYGDDFKEQYYLLDKSFVFYGLFDNCSNIISAKNLILPATDLTGSRYCYSSMFSGCTGLTTAPELPATTLAHCCYADMFSGCTGLTTSPELPATTLASYCYQYMFNGCSKLNYIKMLATNISTVNYALDNWVKGVSSTGTFVKNKDATWNVRGANGIPSGWTVETV